MACDVKTVENLLAANGYHALSNYDRLVCLAGVFGTLAGFTAQQAITQAEANKYGALSDEQLDQAFLASLSASACDAQSLATQIATQKYPSLSKIDLLLALTAAYCAGAGTTAQAEETLLAANGYFAFSKEEADKALLAVSCH